VIHLLGGHSQNKYLHTFEKIVATLDSLSSPPNKIQNKDILSWSFHSYRLDSIYREGNNRRESKVEESDSKIDVRDIENGTVEKNRKIEEVEKGKMGVGEG
jgi:hypothetical protein